MSSKLDIEILSADVSTRVGTIGICQHTSQKFEHQYKQLLPGQLSVGVPRGLAGAASPFEYKDLEGLKKIMDDDDVGVILIKVQRGSEQNPSFREGVREPAMKKKLS